MKHLLLAILALACMLSAQAQSKSSSAKAGVIRVKLKANDEVQIAKQPQKLRASGSSSVETGIQRLDVANKKYKVAEMQRVFPDAGELEEKHRKYGLHLWYELKIDPSLDPEEAAAYYSQEGLVEQAEVALKIARIVSPTGGGSNQPLAQQGHMEQAAGFKPNDDLLGYQWALKNNGSISGSVAGVDINAYDAWLAEKGRPNVVVAVVDGGIDYTHEDLSANMWVNPSPTNGDVYGYNFVANTGVITFDNHGTHVAGIITGVSNNGKGISGVAGGTGLGDGARVMSCQIFDGNDEAPDAAKAIVYAADHGAVICQNSWGYTKPNDFVDVDSIAIEYFINEAGKDKNGNPLPGTPMAGGMVIFAAGNEGSGAKYYPASFEKVISVAAVGPDGKKPSYSNYGPWVNISAPGGGATQSKQILSTIPGNKYAYDYGTSMACPYVSGVAALILSKFGHEGYTPLELRERLLHSAIPLTKLEPTYAPQMGVGLLNAARALEDGDIVVLVSNVEIATKSPVKMIAGRDTILVAKVTPQNATNKKVVWASSNTNYATVDANGRVTAIAAENGQPYSLVQVTATSEDGDHQATCDIRVYADVQVPEGFSPNGDGINDYLRMVLVNGEQYSFMVFDRSGQLCYHDDSYKNGWDGTANAGALKGKKLKAGTYYYSLTAKTSGVVKKGYVVIRY